MKQLEVQIMGQNYLLGCPENGDQRLLEAVGLVDTAMCRIRDAGKVKARDRIAVLAALNLAFELAERPAPLKEPPPASWPDQQVGQTERAPDGGTATPQFSALIQRLDAALGIDGQLL
ncbi:MAG: cell division protein ZapA [Polaromonas sp.]